MLSRLTWIITCLMRWYSSSATIFQLYILDVRFAGYFLLLCAQIWTHISVCDNDTNTRYEKCTWLILLYGIGDIPRFIFELYQISNQIHYLTINTNHLNEFKYKKRKRDRDMKEREKDREREQILVCDTFEYYSKNGFYTG